VTTSLGRAEPSSRRVTLVTGAARRLGAAIAHSFASATDAIVLHHGNSPADAESVAIELRARGALVHVVQADLADVAAPAFLVDEAMRVFGALDVVVSSASVMEWQDFDAVTPNTWNRASDINLRAPFFLMQAAARVMREGGCIIQISDHLAFETIFPKLIPHQVTKSALTQLIRVVASAVAPRLRVNAVAPGLVMAPDDFTDDALANFLKDVPLARSGSPADVVQAIHYLVAATYVTGTVLSVDGGRHLWR
jgi:pteridine reductase